MLTARNFQLRQCDPEIDRVQPFQHHQKPRCDPPTVCRHERQRWQPAVAAWCIPRLSSAHRPHSRQGSRTGDGQIGHADFSESSARRCDVARPEIRGQGQDSGLQGAAEGRAGQWSHQHRNTSSGHCKRWQGVEHRCLVPFSSFSEYDAIDGKKAPVWFAADESRPLLCCAGLWTTCTSVRARSQPTCPVSRRASRTRKWSRAS